MFELAGPDGQKSEAAGQGENREADAEVKIIIPIDQPHARAARRDFERLKGISHRLVKAIPAPRIARDADIMARSF